MSAGPILSIIYYILNKVPRQKLIRGQKSKRKGRKSMVQIDGSKKTGPKRRVQKDGLI